VVIPESPPQSGDTRQKSHVSKACATMNPIGQMRFGDTVLAERRGPTGKGSVLYLAKVTCVMYFDILYDDNPIINKTLQDDILSNDQGVALTKHHHIRAYGQLGHDSSVRWHTLHHPKNPDWVEAADLGRDRDWNHPFPS